MARKVKIKINLPKDKNGKSRKIWIPSIPIYIFQLTAYLAIKFEDHIDIEIPYLNNLNKNFSKKEKLDLSKRFFKKLKKDLKPMEAFDLLRINQKNGMELVIIIK